MCHSNLLWHIFYMYFTQKIEKRLLIVKKCTIIVTIAQKAHTKTERILKKVKISSKFNKIIKFLKFSWLTYRLYSVILRDGYMNYFYLEVEFLHNKIIWQVVILFVIYFVIHLMLLCKNSSSFSRYFVFYSLKIN